MDAVVEAIKNLETNMAVGFGLLILLLIVLKVLDIYTRNGK